MLNLYIYSFKLLFYGLSYKEVKTMSNNLLTFFKNTLYKSNRTVIKL